MFCMKLMIICFIMIQFTVQPSQQPMANLYFIFKKAHITFRIVIVIFVIHAYLYTLPSNCLLTRMMPVFVIPRLFLTLNFVVCKFTLSFLISSHPFFVLSFTSSICYYNRSIILHATFDSVHFDAYSKMFSDILENDMVNCLLMFFVTFKS